jgi:outer membrane lipoprotein-sorting protein
MGSQGGIMVREKWFKIGLLLIVCFFCVSFGLRAETEEGQVKGNPRSLAFAHITESAADLRTISADFTQEKYSSMLKEPLVSTGRFIYEKPDRIYWETDKPSQSGFTVNGDKARRWGSDRSAAETFDAQKEPLVRAIVEQVSAWARADFPWLEKRYRISVTANMPTVLKLYPLSSQEKKYIARLLVTFSGDWSHVGSVEIYENGGDRTRITFRNTVLNEPAPKDLFTR